MLINQNSGQLSWHPPEERTRAPQHWIVIGRIFVVLALLAAGALMMLLFLHLFSSGPRKTASSPAATSTASQSPRARAETSTSAASHGMLPDLASRPPPEPPSYTELSESRSSKVASTPNPATAAPSAPRVARQVVTPAPPPTASPPDSIPSVAAPAVEPEAMSASDAAQQPASDSARAHVSDTVQEPEPGPVPDEGTAGASAPTPAATTPAAMTQAETIPEEATPAPPPPAAETRPPPASAPRPQDTASTDSPPPMAGIPAGAGIARKRVTLSVKNLEPGPEIDSPLRLSSGQRRTIYFFTELRGLDGRTIIHQWEWNGQVMQRRELQPHSQAWRAYSGMPITDTTPGWWTVSAIDAKTGSVLAESRFEIE